MLDPLPPPPAVLAHLTAPLARLTNLTTLPLHIHEVLGAFVVYQSINLYFSPIFSRTFFGKHYNALSHRTRLNWDVHVVSFVQSVVISGLALWVMWVDKERSTMEWQARVHGYTGAGGMLQGFAAGYFLWDLWVCVRHLDVFGWGMLAHAVSALVVFSLGFRPFVNFYGPTFILYELSSPFLNMHWFFDKVNMTGSKAQLYNGLLLLSSFFMCRLVWGTYQSLRVYQDVWAAIQQPGAMVSLGNSTAAAAEASLDGSAETMRFAGDGFVPVWLACTYLGSNIVLNTLNFYWFRKMIEAVRKRFQPPKQKVAVVMNGNSHNASARGSDRYTASSGVQELRRRKA